MKLKSELFQKEQLEIMESILSILDLDEYNGITLYELDNDIVKQNKIIELLPEIKKFFSCRGIKALSSKNDMKRLYLSIIKYVTKIEYMVISSQYLYKINGKNIKTIRYIFIKKIDKK